MSNIIMSGAIHPFPEIYLWRAKATNNFRMILNYRVRTNVFYNYRSSVSQIYNKEVQNPEALLFGGGGVDLQFFSIFNTERK